MGGLRRYAVVVATVFMIAEGAVPAGAAAPPNDTFAGATPIIGVPFKATLDTRQATTDAVDREVYAHCGSEAAEASVWYRFTPSANATVVADVADSNYGPVPHAAYTILVTGTPGAFKTVRCGGAETVYDVTAGQTYHLMAYDRVPGYGNGGILILSLEKFVAAELQFRAHGGGKVSPRTGAAHLSGTFSCAGTEVGGEAVQLYLSQQTGSFTAFGYGNAWLMPCDGAVHPWEINAQIYSGRFVGGEATLNSEARVCGVLECPLLLDTTSIRLCVGDGRRCTAANVLRGLGLVVQAASRALDRHASGGAYGGMLSTAATGAVPGAGSLGSPEPWPARRDTGRRAAGRATVAARKRSQC